VTGCVKTLVFVLFLVQSIHCILLKEPIANTILISDAVEQKSQRFVSSVTLLHLKDT